MPKATPAAKPAVTDRIDRRDRVLIGGHFDTSVQIALKMICAQERRTMQSLLAEAINLVLAKRKQPQIAE
jgi:hypothetical protein